MSLRVCIFQSDKPRERLLSDALAAGFRAHGDRAETRPLGDGAAAEGFDLACMVGVKSKRLYDANWRAGIHTMMLDKGYVRDGAGGGVKVWKYWRVALDGHHPTRYLAGMKMPADRWNRLGLEMSPWRKSGEHVVFAGSSAKYHDFYGLEHPTAYAEKYITKIRKFTDRKVIYRPKPSWEDAIPVSGSTFSFGKGTNIRDVLNGAHCLVTHGSNAVFESVLSGVPCVVLGDAVAKPISSTEVSDVGSPLLVGDDERLQWAANLAYQQWTLREFQSGEAWGYLRGMLVNHCA